jgi:hypothetical protein
MAYQKLRPNHYYLRTLNINDGVTSVADTTNFPADNSFNGDYNPRWRDQVAKGLSATTNAIGTLVDFRPDNIDYILSLKSKQVAGQYQNSQAIGDSIPYAFPQSFAQAPASLVTNVTNRAIRKFLDACDAARSSIELGQDLGEIGETIRGIAHPLQSLREFTFSHLSRVLKLTKTVKHKASLSKMVADTWLEYRFGWRPLALDIGQAYADLTNNNHFNIQPVHGGAFDTFPIGTTNRVHTLGCGNFNIRTGLSITGSYYVGFKGGVKTGQANGRIGLMQNMQLDLPHFVPTIWDLLPYSWIVDYFVNVGDIMHALCFNFNNLSWGQKTTRITNDYVYDNGMEFNFSPTFWTVNSQSTSGGNPSASIVSFTRGALSASDLYPGVQFTLPLGSLRPWENLAALFAGRQKEISRVAKHLR